MTKKQRREYKAANQQRRAKLIWSPSRRWGAMVVQKGGRK